MAGIVDDDQIVIGIERQLIGIKGPFGELRRYAEGFGKQAASGEHGHAGGDSTDELAAGMRAAYTTASW